MFLRPGGNSKKRMIQKSLRALGVLVRVTRAVELGLAALQPQPRSQRFESASEACDVTNPTIAIRKATAAGPLGSKAALTSAEHACSPPPRSHWAGRRRHRIFVQPNPITSESKMGCQSLSARSGLKRTHVPLQLPKSVM